jgi:hypothetical protein
MTVMKYKFTGFITSSTDLTGIVFHNGTANNSGAGLPISGMIHWDLAVPGSMGPHNGTLLYEVDHSGSGGYRPPSDSAVSYSLLIAGVHYESPMNFGTHNTILLDDKQSGASRERFTFDQLLANGHFPMTAPDSSGNYDYLLVEYWLRTSVVDLAGNLLQGLSASQPIQWQSGANRFGTGIFKAKSQLWTGGQAHLYSGTPGAVLINSQIDFVITSFKTV